MYILPQQNANLVDSSVAINQIIGTTDYVNRRYGGTFNFGYMAPGQTSKTIITYLSLSGTAGIKNIKLSITDTGGISFYENAFAYDILDYVDNKFSPLSFFNGVNQNFDKQSPYNISIPNRNTLTSKYVYLNVTLPDSAPFWQGIIRYAWFFDYV